MFLAVSGAFFLIATFELKELILNAVALEVVLSVDELLFDAFMPEAGVRMVQKSMPLRIPRSKGSFLKLYPWLKLLFTFSCLATVSLHTKPWIEAMRSLENSMCGGSLDFLGATLPSGPMVVGVPKTKSIAALRGTYKYLSVYQRTGLDEGQVNRDLLDAGKTTGPSVLTNGSTLEYGKYLSSPDGNSRFGLRIHGNDAYDTARYRLKVSYGSSWADIFIARDIGSVKDGARLHLNNEGNLAVLNNLDVEDGRRILVIRIRQARS